MTETMKVVLAINEHEIECMCEFDYTAPVTGVLTGPPERCYPDEPEEYDPTKLTYVLHGTECDISCLLPLVDDDLDSSFDLWKQKMLSEAEALEEDFAEWYNETY